MKLERLSSRKNPDVFYEVNNKQAEPEVCRVLGWNPHQISTGLNTEELEGHAFTSRSCRDGRKQGLYWSCARRWRIVEFFRVTQSLLTHSPSVWSRPALVWFTEELSCSKCPTGVQGCGELAESSFRCLYFWGSSTFTQWKENPVAARAAGVSAPQGEELQRKGWHWATLMQGQKVSKIFPKAS